MEVEKVGKNPSDGVINKKKWAILFSAFGVVIVGLIIAIVVVLVVRGGGSDDNNQDNNGDEQGQHVEEDFSYEEAVEIYERDSSDIAEELALSAERGDTQYSTRDIMAMYQEKIDATDNVKAKALLKIDYYAVMLGLDTDGSMESEILNGLIEIDDILKTSDSALAVANIAAYYGNNEIMEKYTKIANERMAEDGEPLFEEDKETVG